MLFRAPRNQPPIRRLGFFFILFHGVQPDPRRKAPRDLEIPACRSVAQYLLTYLAINFYPTSKTWSSGQAAQIGYAERPITWNNGIMEGWNNGFRRMKSFFYIAGKTEINPPAWAVFKHQYSILSTIPAFHWTSQGILHPFGVKSKPDPLGSDSC